jgi:predicted RNA-binding protein YlxR (DUF448 family)
VGCGRVGPKPQLVRLVLADDAVVADPEGRRPGRGAYLCPRRSCWEGAVARGRLARAFRRPVEAPAEPLNLFG